MSEHMAEVGVADVSPDPTQSAVVLDVREDDEWDAGHIEGAVHIPMSSVPERLADIPEDRQVLVVCRGGGRSGQVTRYLAGAGRDAVNLAGGMRAWESAGRPMLSELASPPQVI